ncbi:MAG: RNase adapter RapZ, partial [Thermodesulfovibrionales bacterium]
ISEVSGNARIKKIGIGIDIREKGFLSEVDHVLKALKQKHRSEVLFLEAEQEVLLRRFKETRRPHPIEGNIEDALKIEKEILSALKEAADRIIDTSSFTPHQLRRMITGLYSISAGKKNMTLVLISFGFKFGPPQNIDLLFDVRFLPNPHFVPELKPLRGTDKKVADFVLKNKTTKTYVSKIKDLIDFLIPHYIKEGRSYVTIGIGCTGGNHRSPAIVEKLKRSLKRHPVELSIVHRDLN